MIQTEKLVYEYEKRDEEGNVIGTSRAIDEVDIEAKEGQFIAVLGHNGSGKSTLAKHLNAILVPTEGSVWVNGKNTSNPEELWDVRQSAGMVFQNPDNQIIASVVEEDVAFGPENLGFAPAKILCVCCNKPYTSLPALYLLPRRISTHFALPAVSCGWGNTSACRDILPTA